MRKLPIYELEEALVAALKGRECARVMLEAPTGSGKSTQVPQILLDSGAVGEDDEILVMQPRRLAARLLGMRVAAERGSRAGGEVGYTVRFENRSGRETRIRYVTEGILVRRLLEDAELRGVGAVLFDEFHERHLFGDIALARALDLQEASRPDLKIVVMSATLSGERVLEYMQPAERLTSEGRTYPVEIAHAPLKAGRGEAVWDGAARVCGELLERKGAEGDVLVFMPGAFEIHRTIGAIERTTWSRQFEVLPLYGELSPDKQDAAVAGAGARRKIVVATNVAETSVTIDGVRVVVDSGLAREPDFDARRGINTLMIRKISRASADQRAGRAGRTAPGECVRLWSETDHGRREAERAPEVKRLDLTETVLFLKAQGANDLAGFRWLDAPTEGALGQATDLLVHLGAVDRESGTITETGWRMTKFPVHPRFARMLLAAGEAGCVFEIALCVALCQGRSLWVKKPSAAAKQNKDSFVMDRDFSDFQAMLRAWGLAQQWKFDANRCGEYGIQANAAREAGRIARDLLKNAERCGFDVSQGRAADGETIGKVMLCGFSDQLAKRRGKGTLACAVVGGRRGNLAKESVVREADAFVAAEIAEIEGKDVNVILSSATAVDLAWLEEMYPDDFTSGDNAVWDATQRRVVRLKETRFRDLVLESRPSGEADAEAAAEILASEVCAGNLVLKKWDAAVEQWIARVNFLAKVAPELKMPVFGDEDKLIVVTQACRGARSYKEIKDRPVWDALKSWLSRAQSDCLEKMAPERVTLSNGRSAKVKYRDDGEPVISVILQQLYDVHETPRVAGGKVPVLVEVLAPNRRPAQITRDLAGFWKSSYAAVKNELKGRYPKHEWR